jgi:serine/threonine-protein kinase RsbW
MTKPTHWPLFDGPDDAFLNALVRPMPEQWKWRLDRVIPSDPAAGRRVLGEIVAQLEAEHWEQHDVFSVHLAAEEALVNAILHGNRRDANKHVRVSCFLSADLVRVEIADEGPGFNPKLLPDPTCADRIHSPGGRGVMLMRAFMSRVEYNAAGNCVVLEKERARASV